MTVNKRFSVYGKEIVQGDECWAVAYSEHNADVIATALNELNDEKEMWKRECERLKGLYYLENEKDEHLGWKRVDVE